MPDYSRSKIYKITNSVNEMKYIGSTTKKQLSSRMADHRDNNKLAKYDNVKLYNEMKKVGVENFQIQLIELFPCTCKDELNKRELQEVEANDQNVLLNMISPIKPKVPGYNKEYYNDHKVKLLQEGKVYYRAHKDERAEKDKAKYEANKEDIAAKRKVFFNINRDRINVKTHCESCDIDVMKRTLKSHQQTKKHHANIIVE